MSKANILHLSVDRSTFQAIADGKQVQDFRDRNEYWRSRLNNKEFELVRCRSGTGSSAPEIDLEFLGVTRVVREGRGQYAIKMGEIRSLKNWPN